MKAARGWDEVAYCVNSSKHFSALVFLGSGAGCVLPGKRKWCDQMRRNAIVRVRENDCFNHCSDGCGILVDGASLIFSYVYSALLPVMQRRDALKAGSCV